MISEDAAENEESDADMDTHIFTKRQVEVIISQTSERNIHGCMQIADARAEKLQKSLEELSTEKTQMQADAQILGEKPRQAQEALKKSQILPGTIVQIKGLQQREDLNGRKAKVMT